MRKLLLSIYDVFFPQWKTYISKVVVLERVSLILNRGWDEDAVLVVQKSIAGRMRAYVITCGRREPVDIDFVRAFVEI